MTKCYLCHDKSHHKILQAAFLCVFHYWTLTNCIFPLKRELGAHECNYLSTGSVIRAQIQSLVIQQPFVLQESTTGFALSLLSPNHLGIAETRRILLANITELAVGFLFQVFWTVQWHVFNCSIATAHFKKAVASCVFEETCACIFLYYSSGSIVKKASIITPGYVK